MVRGVDVDSTDGSHHFDNFESVDECVERLKANQFGEDVDVTVTASVSPWGCDDNIIDIPVPVKASILWYCTAMCSYCFP